MRSVDARLVWRGVVLAALLASPALAQAPAGVPAAGARIDRAPFAHQRRVPPGAPGIAWLRLDLAALSHSTLSDIRLVTDDGFQVPYLLEADQDPLRVTLPPPAAVDDREATGILGRRRGRQQTVYALPLPLASMPPCQLVLRTPARVFEREVTVAARSDRPGSRAPGGWQVLAWRSWRHADPEREAPPLAIDLPSVASTDARLILDEGDNQPLPLERPVLELRTWRLRFVRETGDGLWLVYGRRDLAAPKYDLELRETRLKQEAAHEVVAEPEPSPAARGAWGRPATVFWTALVLAVIALLALLARLLRPGAESTGPQA